MDVAMSALLPWFVRLELLGGVCLQGSSRLALRLSSLCKGARILCGRMRRWQSFWNWLMNIPNSPDGRNVVAELVEGKLFHNGFITYTRGIPSGITSR